MRPALVFLTLILAANPAAAQLTGYYSVTPPTAGYYTVVASSTFGNWTATNLGVGSSFLSTLPDASTFGALTLSDGIGTQGAMSMLITPLATSMVSVDWDRAGSASIFKWTADSGSTWNMVFGTSGSLSFGVVPTDSFGFYIESPAVANGAGQVNFSNFGITAIPEPATFGVFASCGAFLAVAYAKRRGRLPASG